MDQFQDASYDSDHSGTYATMDETASCSSSSLSSHDLSIETSKKMGVRFATTDIEYHEVESRTDYSSKERARYWLSDHEKDKTLATQERLVEKYKMQMLKKSLPWLEINFSDPLPRIFWGNSLGIPASDSMYVLAKVDMLFVLTLHNFAVDKFSSFLIWR